MSSYCVPTSSLLSILLLLYLMELSLGQMSCGPRMSPRLLMEIPCDMTKSSFCTLPGSAYPWSSVRRYIYENQGFMRRMYGDQRQSQVLRNEIEESREKYDSIYFYGRGRAQTGPFGPRSASNDFTPTISSSTTFSLESNSSVDYQPNTNVENNTSPTNESESKSTLGRESIHDEEETYSMENSQFDLNPSTTTINTNHEANDIPKPSPYADLFVSSAAPQTTTSSETDSEENEAQPKKGVNACPIKEEVVAPYWANNTRGETLALLNVYPFEQYIHWEKCAYENSQMFCRDGCKCEQQYRLHRLLAFDPKNECRGIFADWFRFPGCCVCICYDLPESIRVNRRKARL